MDREPVRTLVAALGLDQTEVTSVELIHEKHGNRLYRVKSGARTFVLKWFVGPSTEARSNALLERLSVPTLPVYGRTEDALLLEDLADSALWRLAKKEDVERSETGAAVASWYLSLHSAGQDLLTDPVRTPSFLNREIDALDAGSIVEAGKRLDSADNHVWKLAADQIEVLKGAMQSLPETLNYNDFYWGNLALSRRREPSLQVIVFDYHLLGIGLRYSDCRNVVGSLGDQAASAFWEVYGPVDEREMLLDEPTSVLFALVDALRRSRFPSWAQDCLRKAQSGELERSLRRALEVI